MPYIKNIMAIDKKQENKNEKEEKSLQAVKNAGKVSLDDELLGAVAGGDDIPADDTNDGLVWVIQYENPLDPGTSKLKIGK